MIQRTKLFTMLSTTAMVFLSMLLSIQVQAQTTYSGRANGIIANAEIALLSGTFVTTNARIADTGFLPPQGGFISRQVAGANTQILLAPIGLNNAISARIINTSTGGGGAQPGTFFNTSQSKATVEDLNFTLLGGTLGAVNITATTIEAQSICTCTQGDTVPACSGSTIITNLVVRNSLGNVVFTTGTLLIMPAPNTVINLPLFGISIILNQQTRNPIGSTDNITVNAIRVIFDDPSSASTADIIVSQAYSDIMTCMPPVAADISISGRVLSSRKRGVANATVQLISQSGIVQQTARTNSFGYFSFRGIPSGEVYFVNVLSKRYRFDTQVITPTENLAELNFIALSEDGTNTLFSSQEK